MVNRNAIYYSGVVALGGFLFGFDTAVISGAEQAIQQLWQLNAFEHGLTVSIALIGTVLGALFGGIPSDRLGRKPTLFWIGMLYLVSAVGSAMVQTWEPFLFFRFIGGLAVGASSVAAPLYISEISPEKNRGGLVALFQFNIVFGILLAFLSNYVIAQTDLNDSWRWMLGVQAIPALIFGILIRTVSESPRWLILRKNDEEQARKVFQQVGEEHIDYRIELIRQSPPVALVANRWITYKKPITLAILFAFFNQLSGINAIIYYAPRIFEMTGLGKSSALLSSVGIGLVNFIFTLAAIAVIDKIGRKALMHIGSFGLIVTLSLVAFAFYSTNLNTLMVPVYLYAYIAFFAFSQGAVIWVFISEIFPNEVRAFGQSLGSFTHWILAAAIAFAFPSITTSIGPGNTFLIFAIMMVLQWIFVFTLMPETRGKSLEELGKSLSGK